MTMKKVIAKKRKSNALSFCLIASSVLFSINTQAAELTISIRNITKGIHFTPVLFTAHPADFSLFRSGIPASPELRILAESGDATRLASLASNMGSTTSISPTTGFVPPGSVTTTNLSTSPNQLYLSLASMVLPSNDGFVGISRWLIPTVPGTYNVRLNAYDAGTEANTEIVADMPSPPILGLGAGGTGVTNTISNNTVHIHPSNLGDFNPTGGISDINATVHRWLNPVAIMTVVVR